MSDRLTAGGWMVVGENCSVRRAAPSREGYLAFVFEGGGSEFELSLSPDMLRRMADLGGVSPPRP